MNVHAVVAAITVDFTPPQHRNGAYPTVAGSERAGYGI